MAELKPTTVTIVELTAKEYAAIHLCVPDSGNDELDAMIRRAQREKLAGRAMQGIISKSPFVEHPQTFEVYNKTALGAYDYADALIAAGEGKP
jgi:hypothetical protein